MAFAIPQVFRQSGSRPRMFRDAHQIEIVKDDVGFLSLVLRYRA